MSRFTTRIAPFVEAELTAAEQARYNGRVHDEFACLERAHVLGQASTYWHVKVHVLMLRWAWRNRAAREWWGQCLRILGAAALTAPGWVPEGNTGGANVSPIKPMPVPPDLAASIRLATSVGD